MRKMIFAALVAAMASLSGCMDASTEVYVKKDGSGTVTERVYLTKSARAMMAAMAAGMNKEGTAPDPLEIKMDELKAKAATMGEGVTLVSADKDKNASGDDGTKVVYAFKDITKLKLSEMPGANQGGMQGAAPAKEETPSATFAFTKGDTAKLSITSPKPKADAAKADAAKGAPEAPKPTDEQFAQAKQMLDGLKIKMRIVVEGAIVKTNAAYADKDNKGVTVMEMDFSELLKNKEQFEKLTPVQKAQQTGDEAKVKELLKALPGMKVDTADKIDIEFK